MPELPGTVTEVTSPLKSFFSGEMISRNIDSNNSVIQGTD